MEFRNLGKSGLRISEIAYGNWLTHGSQVEQEQALDVGITTFDTADTYADTKAESVLGEALKSERRGGLEIFTKVYFPMGQPGQNDHGLSRKHIHESINGSLRRVGTHYVDLYQAHRFDDQTPLEETMEAFADVVRQGKALYMGVLTGKYQPGQAPPAGSRATDQAGGADMIGAWLTDPVLAAVQQLTPLAKEAGLSMSQMALAWVLQNNNVSAAIIGASRPEQVIENAKAAGVKLEAGLLSAIDDVLKPVVQLDPAMTTSPQRSTFS